MSGATPKVTVVIPCYNLGRYIDEAVDSVLAQTFQDFEIIIVDDGSDDPFTVAKLEQYCKPKTRVIRTPNCGVAAARNRGIHEAAGEYILPLDADDRIDHRYLEMACTLLGASAGRCIVSCGALLFGGASGIMHLPEYSDNRLLSENLLFNSSLFLKSDWQDVGGYCVSFRYGWEDWDFWIAMTSRGVSVARIPEPLLHYRIRTDSRDRSMTIGRKCRMLLKMLVRHFDCYVKSPCSLMRLLKRQRRAVI